MRKKLIALALAAIMANLIEGVRGIETLGSRTLLNQAPVLAGDSYTARHSNPRASVAWQFSGRITEIDKQNKTLTIDEKRLGKETLHMAVDTRVLRGEENAAWEQLKVGDQVRATARKSGQINRALTIELAR
ncbi:MAG: hypothetical protein JWL90_2513 [Chthoniobacteraceae bacterium]|nr:hypothetical protein [Chthoniobacteraceae bacterium]MDB6171391.1 hypothetical protein [Chthoniobacteraceae bacterium]